MRGWMTIGLFVVMSLAGGCAHGGGSMQKNYRFELRKFSLTTEPAGAAVYQIGAMDGARTLLGTTPLKEQSVAVPIAAKFKGISPEEMQSIMSQMEMAHVSIEKPGYQSYRGNLATTRGKVTEHTIKLEPASAKETASVPTAP